MWRSNPKMWQLAFTAAWTALLIGISDCYLADCGLGTAIIGFRLSAAFALLSLGTYVIFHKYYFQTKTRNQLLVSAIAASPLAVYAAVHLSKTAVLNRLLGYHYRIAVPLIVLFTLFGALCWLFTSNHKRLKSIVVHVASILFAALLFGAATYFKKLHYPLAVASLSFCWLAIQRPLIQFSRRWLYQVHLAGALSLMVTGAAMTLWPISLEDTFAASDQGIISRDIVYWGKAHTINELVQQAPMKPIESPPQMTQDDVMLPHVPEQSVVLISVDALRPDHLSINGYPRNVSPNIDQLLQHAVLFENAYCSAPTSSFSIPSIHAGMPMEERLKSRVSLPPLLAEHFGDMGYKTVGLFPQKIFSVGPELMESLESGGFGFEESRLLKMDARKDVDMALSFLAAERTKPLFLWIHFYDPHLPYTCHDKPFGDRPQDCYDAEIAYLDKHIKRLILGIEKHLDNPVIAFTADHAEAFGEHGRYYHSTDLYDEQIKVPLAFIVPGVPPKRVFTPVSNCSIFDTLLSLVQPVDRPLSRDLRPHMVSESTSRPILSAINRKRAVIFDSHKLICEDWPKGACALFDLTQDPAEQTNLAAKNISNTMELLSMLKAASQQELQQLQKDTPPAIILGRLKRPGAEKGLMALAQSPSSQYAVEASRLLAFLKNDDMADALCELEQSKSEQVAAWASIGNGLLKNGFETKNLLKFLGKHSRLGDWSAIVLGRDGDDRALNPLLALLKNDEPYLRAQAALSLGELGNKRAVNGLISLLKIKQSRWAAIEALGALEDRRALHILTRLKKQEPDINNIPRYERAIERIENN